MPTLTIDEQTHEYRVDDRPVLGVTKIIALAGLSDMSFVSEEGLKRGSYVHETIELYIKGQLDEADLDPALVGFLNAYKAFERENKFKVRRVDGIWQTEVRKAHPLYAYAGTVDIMGDIGSHFLAIDIKSGESDSWHGEQLAAYAMLFDFPAGSPRPERANLYVRPDGTYRFVERKDRKDFDVFKAALTIAQARVARGLVK